MRESNQYIIPISGLADGEHSYFFRVGKDFFVSFEKSDIHGGSVNIDIVLNKSGKTMRLDLSFTGEVILPCDRCLDDLKLPVNIKESLIVEYGVDNKDSYDDNIISIGENSKNIDIRQHILEYIVLSLPYRKIHGIDKNGNSLCNPEMIEKIERLSSFEIEDENIDPRWNELKKIKNGTS